MRTVMNETSPLSPTDQLLRFAFDGNPERSPLQMSRPILAATQAMGSYPILTDAVDRQSAAVLLLAQSISNDNGTADIDISGPAFDFVRSIKVWRVDYYQHRESGPDDDCSETDRTFLGTYGEQGDFQWRPSRARNVPAWMNLSISCHSGQGLYRGVGIEWHDYEGRHGHELVRY